VELERDSLKEENAQLEREVKQCKGALAENCCMSFLVIS